MQVAVIRRAQQKELAEPTTLTLVGVGCGASGLTDVESRLPPTHPTPPSGTPSFLLCDGLED